MEENRQEAELEEETSPEAEEEPSGKKVPIKKYKALQEKLEKAEADMNNWKNQYYKAYADTQNLRRSLEEETRSAIRYRAEGFVSGLIPALDAFHMALEAPPPTKECANYLIGFGYIYNQLIEALSSEGVSEISPKVGDKFDATLMHAMEAIEDDSVPEGTICKIYGKGYKLHDRLITPARVAVAKAKSEEKEAKENQEENNQPEEEVPQA